jgi:hypothetical protein
LMPAMLLVALVGGWPSAAGAQLTAYERAQGWRLLFDGRSLQDWHSFGSRRVSANWRVEEGAVVAEEGRALVTDGSYADFELSFAWRIRAGGRAEVYFRVAEDAELPGHTGPVFQLAGPDTEPGGNGGLIAPEPTSSAQPGEWQSARLVVSGDRVEHWIAGRSVLVYSLASPEWRAAVAASRFAEFRDFGRLSRGGIALSGHGAEFRQIKLRAL